MNAGVATREPAAAHLLARAFTRNDARADLTLSEVRTPRA
jgi:hypothetical protein